MQIDLTVAKALLSQKIPLVAVKEKRPTAKWKDGLPITTEAQLQEAVALGCDGFAMRPADGGYIIIDIDKKGGKDGFKTVPFSLTDCAYVIQTPSGGGHFWYKSEPIDSIVPLVEGVDLICKDRLITIPGSKGYIPLAGHLNNVSPFKIDLKKYVKPAPEKKVYTPPKDNIFESAKRMISRYEIERLFGREGSYWVGPEFWTLNPLRTDKKIGSFSINTETGLYFDFSSDDKGDIIDLIAQTQNKKPYEVATSYAPVDVISPTTRPSKKFKFKKIKDFTFEEPDFLVQGLFESDSLGLVYGPPAVGKSFFSLDLSLCIAMGMTFHGLKTKKGSVMYLAGEGHRGIQRRVKAWETHNKVDASDANWFLASQPFELMSSGSCAEVLEAFEEFGTIPKIVVIDTLARNFGDGDENKTQDMGIVIRNADAIRVKYGCLVLIVHHSGHESERARGSSSLKAAMDYEYSVSQNDDGLLSVRNTKMKDGEIPEPMHFRLFDCDRSAVLIKEEVESKKENVRGKNQKIGFEILMKIIDERRETLVSVGRHGSDAKVSDKELRDAIRLDGRIKEGRISETALGLRGKYGELFG